MKFLVDEMPFWADDCPFHRCYEGVCELDKWGCEYMSRPAGDRIADECRWLRTMEVHNERE